MKISKPDESSLLIGLTEGLQGAKITYYNYLSLPNDWEKNLKASFEDDFRKKLYSLLDDGGLESLIQRTLMVKFHSLGLDLPPENQSKSLSSYNDFSDCLKLSREVVNIIKSAPHQYIVFCRAPTEFSSIWPDDFEMRISDRFWILKGNKLKGEVKLTTGDEKIDDLYVGFGVKSESKSNIEIDDDSVYFKYFVNGIVSDRFRPKCFSDFYDDVRAFFGACISFKLMHEFPFQKLRRPIFIFANRVEKGEASFRFAESAETDIADCLALPLQKSSKDILASMPNDPAGAISLFLKPVVKMFNNSESARLKTAAIWLLRAHRSSRGMDQILDATIAIEVLLGDREASDRIGLSKLMANRCAYALGRSSEERRRMHDFFIKFYRVRSDIVHAGRLKLSESEREVVDEGTKLASRILYHESEIA